MSNVIGVPRHPSYDLKLTTKLEAGWIIGTVTAEGTSLHHPNGGYVFIYRATGIMHGA